MPWALKSSFKPVYRSLSRDQSLRLQYNFLTNNGFHTSNRRSLLSEFEFSRRLGGGRGERGRAEVYQSSIFLSLSPTRRTN
jgi:hypothetical protein